MSFDLDQLLLFRWSYETLANDRQDLERRLAQAGAANAGAVLDAAGGLEGVAAATSRIDQVTEAASLVDRINGELRRRRAPTQIAPAPNDHEAWILQRAEPDENEDVWETAGPAERRLLTLRLIVLLFQFLAMIALPIATGILWLLGLIPAMVAVGQLTSRLLTQGSIAQLVCDYIAGVAAMGGAALVYWRAGDAWATYTVSGLLGTVIASGLIVRRLRRLRKSREIAPARVVA